MTIEKTSTMKIFMLGIGAILSCNLAAAQQTASANFAQPKVAAATFDFPKEETAPVNCTQTVQVPVGCHHVKRPHRAARKISAAAGSAAVKKTDDKPFDPLAVHSDVSVKDAQQKEILLPGVMKIAGANADALDFSKSRVVDVSNNGSETVYLSYDYPNRIQIPWVNPKIVGADQLTIDKTPVSNNIYIHFKDGVTEPVQVYFDHVDGIGDVLGLQLIPKHIPAQTIIVRDTSRLNGESIKAPKGNDYVTQTQALIETVELGGTPQGFSKIDLKLPPIVMNGLTINTDKQFSSTDRDVFVYTVENPAKTVATLTEKEFDGANVLAVSIFPKPILRVGERAMVVVVARKVKGDDHGQ